MEAELRSALKSGPYPSTGIEASKRVSFLNVYILMRWLQVLERRVLANRLTSLEAWKELIIAIFLK
jgi:hypothetical protein